MSKITLAKTAGFCFGVNRAVNLVCDLLAQGKKVCTLGPLIHNPRMVAELGQRGARIVSAPSEAAPGELLVVRTHGVPASVMEEARAAGVRTVDATCPFVKKIHRVVREQSDAGALILIAGDPNHPEVQGIRGHCGESRTFRNLAELERLTRSEPSLTGKKTAVVAQTTFNSAEWQKCHVFIKKIYTNAFIFDTICDATAIRQREARELAKASDLMVIIGGKQSSNTAKLVQVCSEFCRAVLVEDAAGLPFDEIRHSRRVGVTTGASTPAPIIKEVLKAMAEQNPENDVNFEEALNQSFKTISSGDRVRGVVINVGPTEVQIDIGTKHAGYIPAAEFGGDSTKRPCDLVKVGDELDLIATRVDDVEGTVMLSKKRVDALKSWDEIVKASEDGTVLNGTVTEVINGGVLTSYNGVRVFIPASQSGVRRDQNLDIILHKPVEFKIIDINPQRKRAVGSISAVLKEKRKDAEDKFWATAQVGDKFNGTVKSLTSYGAFVDIGGVDGMIHISELSWSRIKHPSEIVNVGDQVDVTIKALDPEKKRISLSYDKKGRDPWEIFLEEYHVGDVFEAEIVNMMPFGAFARIMPDVDGLIHISQISDERIAKPQDVLKLGEKVRVKITGIDTDKRRISLSMREAENEPETVTDELGENTDAQPENVPDNSTDELGENTSVPAPEAPEDPSKE